MRKYFKTVTLTGFFAVLVFSATMIAYANNKSAPLTVDAAASSYGVNPTLAVVAAAIVMVVAVGIYIIRHMREEN